MSVHGERYYGPPRRQPHPVKSDNFQRASDAEREAVVEQLRLNCAEGRITMDEFGDRTTKALAARTGGELRAVLADLPVVSAPVTPAEKAKRKHVARKAVLIPYLGVNLLLIAIWAATCLASWKLNYFWPLWPILGWGIGVVSALLAIGRSDGQRWPEPGSSHPPQIGT
jgi:hypothetical protein